MMEFLSQFSIMFVAGLAPMAYFAAHRTVKFYDWLNERQNQGLSILGIYVVTAFLMAATGLDVMTAFAGTLGFATSFGSVGFGAAVSFFILKK